MKSSPSMPRRLTVVFALCLSCSKAPPPAPSVVSGGTASATNRSAAPQNASGSANPSPSAAASPALSATVSHTPNPKELDAEVKRALAKSPCTTRGKLVLLSGHAAAVVPIVCPDPPDPTREEPAQENEVLLVGALPGKSIRSDAGLEAEPVIPHGNPFLTLRRNGPPTLLIEVTELRSHGMLPRVVYQPFELIDEGWQHLKSEPKFPERGKDLLGDGEMEFPVTLGQLSLGECYPNMACGSQIGTYEAAIYLRGLERWDGAAYASDLAELAPAYRGLLAKVREQVRRRGVPKTDEPYEPEVTKDYYNECFLGRIRMAGEVYMYRVMLGDPTADALLESDAIMKDFDVAPCVEKFGLHDPPAWPELRKALAAIRLPALVRPTPP